MEASPRYERDLRMRFELRRHPEVVATSVVLAPRAKRLQEPLPTDCFGSQSQDPEERLRPEICNLDHCLQSLESRTSDPRETGSHPLPGSFALVVPSVGPNPATTREEGLGLLPPLTR